MSPGHVGYDRDVVAQSNFSLIHKAIEVLFILEVNLNTSELNLIFKYHFHFKFTAVNNPGNQT